MDQTLVDLMQQTAQLNSRAAEAAARGDVAEAMSLHSQAEQLMQRAKRLTSKRATRSNVSRAPSVRERAVTALTELNVPCAPKEIAAYCEARQAEPFDVRALASIRRDELRGWESGRSRRVTFLVPALEGQWFVAGRGRFALSHWPLSRRIITPLSPRVDHLRVCRTLARMVQVLDDDGQNLRLSKLLVVYARSLAGALDDAWKERASIDPQRIIDATQAELDLIEKDDDITREREAERAMRLLDERKQLWGGDLPEVLTGLGR